MQRSMTMVAVVAALYCSYSARAADTLSSLVVVHLVLYVTLVDVTVSTHCADMKTLPESI